jgi:hypothetical protein
MFSQLSITCDVFFDIGLAETESVLMEGGNSSENSNQGYSNNGGSSNPGGPNPHDNSVGHPNQQNENDENREQEQRRLDRIGICEHPHADRLVVRSQDTPLPLPCDFNVENNQQHLALSRPYDEANICP